MRKILFIASYALNLFKVFSTISWIILASFVHLLQENTLVLALDVLDFTMRFSILTPLVMLLVPTSDMTGNLVISLIIRFSVIGICLLLWLSLFVLSILVVKLKKSRIALFAISIATAGLDFITTLIFSDLPLKISCGVIFCIVAMINLPAIFVTLKENVFIGNRVE